MTLENSILVALSLMLIAYLIYALLRPERF
jgi:K+-transporting ATPase KdpF subunit